MVMFPSSDLVASSVSSRMCHIALLRLAKIFAAIRRLFRASSIINLLTPISLRVLTSVVNSGMVLVFNVSMSNATGNSSFPLMKCSYFFFFLARYSTRVLFVETYPLPTAKGSFQWMWY